MLGLGLLVALLGITGWALEASDVAILETRSPDGERRRTHVWYAEHAGELWLEAATPERAWLRDLQATADVSLERADHAQSFRAVAIPGPEARVQVRALLRGKYGWRDRWVGLFQDTSAAVAVRLAPAAPAEPGEHP